MDYRFEDFSKIEFIPLTDQIIVNHLSGKEIIRVDPYNPIIANTFFRAGEIESWGRGIQQMIDACRIAGIPEPKINFFAGDFSIEFLFSKKYMSILNYDSSVTDNSLISETTQETTQEKIVALLRSNPFITRKELAKAVMLTEDGIKYHLDRLRKEGRIRHIGSTKKGRWEIQEG